MAHQHYGDQEGYFANEEQQNIQLNSHHNHMNMRLTKLQPMGDVGYPPTDIDGLNLETFQQQHYTNQGMSSSATAESMLLSVHPSMGMSHQPREIFMKREPMSPKKRKYSNPSADESMVSPDIASNTASPSPSSPNKVVSIDWENNLFVISHKVFNSYMNPIEFSFAPCADKGFKYSEFDAAFICQKKNHFQFSYSVSFDGLPKFVASENGFEEVKSASLFLHGIKTEDTTQIITLEQSTPNRIRKPLEEIDLGLSKSRQGSGTVQRLHFSQPTAYNYRQRNKANPSQRYFYLVATIKVKTKEGTHLTIASKRTPRLICRSSNPRQFTLPSSDMQTNGPVVWMTDDDGETIFHHGAIGVNTSCPNPSDALSVCGNIKMQGKVLSEIPPSVNLGEKPFKLLDASESLDKVKRLDFELYLQPGATWGQAVYVQNLNEVIPEAVVVSDSVSSEAAELRTTRAVDIERLLYESLNATKALGRALDDAVSRIHMLQDEVNMVRGYLSNNRGLANFNSTTSVNRSSVVSSHPPHDGHPQSMHSNLGPSKRSHSDF
eukprot:m.273849 g.273849  ORF g.273849 m.273849 type:complete len:549 (-) comp109322_c0_seq1:67-1713(-)